MKTNSSLSPSRPVSPSWRSEQHLWREQGFRIEDVSCTWHRMNSKQFCAISGEFAWRRRCWSIRYMSNCEHRMVYSLRIVQCLNQESYHTVFQTQLCLFLRELLNWYSVASDFSCSCEGHELICFKVYLSSIYFLIPPSFHLYTVTLFTAGSFQFAHRKTRRKELSLWSKLSVLTSFRFRVLQKGISNFFLLLGQGGLIFMVRVAKNSS